MTQADRLVEIAVSQLGEEEEPKGSNKTKYGIEYGWNGVPWCMQFVWWCFKKAGLSDLFYGGNKTASCTTLMKWAANNGLFVVGDYRKGDVFLYDQDGVVSDSEHTGIYTGVVNGERLVAIEGNYADAVCSVSRKPSEIIGAFRAAWEDEDSQRYDVTVELPEVKFGDVGESVKAMQILLEGYGFSVGRCGCDGEFGEDTRLALLRYQKKSGLDCDSICGVDTWSSMLK